MNHYDGDDDVRCRTGDVEYRPTSKVWTVVNGFPTILTDGPIADRRGKVIEPAAPGNRVPVR